MLTGIWLTHLALRCGRQSSSGLERRRGSRTCVVIFGYTEEQISAFFMTYGIGAFILFMLFIIGHLAWESKAGKFGTFVLFLGLAVGFIGFIAKYIIQWYLEK